MKNASLNSLLFLVVFVTSLKGIFSLELSRQAPVITSQFEKNYWLVKGVNVKRNFTCSASGRPKPSIIWTKNRQRITDEEMIKAHDPGVLHIGKSSTDLFGMYQCSAENQHGQSASTPFYIKEAELVSFNEESPISTYKVTQREHLSLKCFGRPMCAPSNECSLAWKRGQGTVESIITNKRIAVDNDGTLHILQALVSDGTSPASYGCSVWNELMKGLVKSSLATVNENGHTVMLWSIVSSQEWYHRHDFTLNFGVYDKTIMDFYGENERKYVPPLRLYNKDVTGLVGNSATLQCIFSGFPLPTITWSFGSRILDPDFDSGVMYDIFENGEVNRRKLIIKNLRADHEGAYDCTATQQIPGSQDSYSLTASLYLNVTGPPQFEEDLQPQVKSRNSDVTFTCKATSLPDEAAPKEPVWYQNDEPVNFTDWRNFQKSMDGTRFTLINVQMSSTSNIKCQVSNFYGTSYSQTYLTVIEEITIKDKPPRNLKVSPGSKKSIFVNAASDPEVVLSYSWQFKEISGDVYKESMFPNFLRTSSDHRNLTIDATNLTDINIYRIVGVITVNISHAYDYKTVSIDVGIAGNVTYTDIVLLNKPPKSVAIAPGESKHIYINAASGPAASITYTWRFRENSGAIFTQENLPDFFRLSRDNKNLTINGSNMTSATVYDLAGVLLIFMSNGLTHTTYQVVINIAMNANQGLWSEWEVGRCSLSCGDGLAPRKRSCGPIKHRNKKDDINAVEQWKCIGEGSQTVTCNTRSCMEWEWSEWSACKDQQQTRLKSCGVTGNYAEAGTQTRPCALGSCQKEKEVDYGSIIALSIGVALVVIGLALILNGVLLIRKSRRMGIMQPSGDGKPLGMQVEAHNVMYSASNDSQQST